MFSKKRKNYSIFLYTALILTICALLAVLLWPEPVAVSNNEENINVNSQTNTTDNSKELQEEVKTETPQKNEDNEDETLTETNSKSYYIVKKNDDVISVYFVTDNGSKVKLEDTDILYELLPIEDQNKFDQGIVIEDQEKLATLLQDYES